MALKGKKPHLSVAAGRLVEKRTTEGGWADWVELDSGDEALLPLPRSLYQAIPGNPVTVVLDGRGGLLGIIDRVSGARWIARPPKKALWLSPLAWAAVGATAGLASGIGATFAQPAGVLGLMLDAFRGVLPVAACGVCSAGAFAVAVNRRKRLRSARKTVEEAVHAAFAKALKERWGHGARLARLNFDNVSAVPRLAIEFHAYSTMPVPLEAPKSAVENELLPHAA